MTNALPCGPVSIVSSNLGAFLLIRRSACGSSWKLSASSASKALRCLRRLAAESRTRLALLSLIRTGINELESPDLIMMIFLIYDISCIYKIHHM